jgi:hypothetical protein
VCSLWPQLQSFLKFSPKGIDPISRDDLLQWTKWQQINLAFSTTNDSNSKSGLLYNLEQVQVVGLYRKVLSGQIEEIADIIKQQKAFHLLPSLVPCSLVTGKFDWKNGKKYPTPPERAPLQINLGQDILYYGDALFVKKSHRTSDSSVCWGLLDTSTEQYSRMLDRLNQTSFPVNTRLVIGYAVSNESYGKSMHEFYLTVADREAEMFAKVMGRTVSHLEYDHWTTPNLSFAGNSIIYYFCAVIFTSDRMISCKL